MNLKVLPHETTLRFALLCALALATAMDVADRLSWHVFLSASLRGRHQCRAAGVLLADLDACMIHFTRSRLLWDLAVALGAIAVGAGLALAASLIRRRGLVAVPPAAVGDAVSRANPGLHLLWKPPGRVNFAKAEGIRRPYVEVGLGFMSLAQRDPKAAQAGLRHERAHHELKDVVQARICLWLPWVLVAMMILVLALPQPASWRPVMIGTAPRTLLLVALMFLVRASFLRAREIAADNEARAPEPADLIAAIGAAPDPPPWWRRPFASHPARAWRQEAIRDPSAACRVTASDGIMLGLVTAACTSVVTQVAVAWNNWGPAEADAATVAWGVLGGPLGWWVAVMVMRIAAASRFGARVSPAPFAVGLGVGVAVGGFVTLGQPGSPGITFGLVTWGASALLGATAVALAIWIWGVAQWWLDLDLAERGAAWTERGVQIFGCLAGASLLGAASQIQFQAWTAADRISSLLFRHAFDGDSGYGMGAVLVVAGLPLWLLRRPRRAQGSAPSWLSTPPRTNAVPDAPMIRPGLRTAAIGGVIATGAYAGAATVWTKTIPLPESWYFALIEVPTVLLAPSAVLAATVVCAAVQARSSQLAVAMVPACVAVAISSLGIVLLRTATTRRLDWWMAKDVLISLAVGGVLGGLVLAATVLVLAESTRRVRWPGLRLPIVTMPILAAIAGIALVAGATQLRLTPVHDLTQVGWVHDTVNRENGNARRQCRGEPVTPQGASQARAAIERLGQRSANPATADVRRAHLRRMAMWEACVTAINAALDSGRKTIRPEEQKQFVIADGGTVWLRQPSECEIYADLHVRSLC
jgi:hypothetical protein